MNNHLSGIAVASNLKQPTRIQREQRYRIPIWPCFQWGLPCRTDYSVRGALLPHHFTLTILQWRFVFCGTIQWFTPSRCYLALCSMKPGLSSVSQAMQRLFGRLGSDYKQMCGACKSQLIELDLV